MCALIYIPCKKFFCAIRFQQLFRILLQPPLIYSVKTRISPKECCRILVCVTIFATLILYTLQPALASDKGKLNARNINSTPDPIQALNTVIEERAPFQKAGFPSDFRDNGWQAWNSAQHLIAQAKHIRLNNCEVTNNEIEQITNIISDYIDRASPWWWNSGEGQSGDENLNRMILLGIFTSMEAINGCVDIINSIGESRSQKITTLVKQQIESYSTSDSKNPYAGSFPNQDLTLLLIIRIHDKIVGTGSRASEDLSNQIIRQLSLSQLPSGEFSYIGTTRQANSYHGLMIAMLAHIYDVRPDIRIKSMLRNASKYMIDDLLVDGTTEYWTAPWWKQYWTPTDTWGLVLANRFVSNDFRSKNGCKSLRAFRQSVSSIYQLSIAAELESKSLLPPITCYRNIPTPATKGERKTSEIKNLYRGQLVGNITIQVAQLENKLNSIIGVIAPSVDSYPTIIGSIEAQVRHEHKIYSLLSKIEKPKTSPNHPLKFSYTPLERIILAPNVEPSQIQSNSNTPPQLTQEWSWSTDNLRGKIGFFSCDEKYGCAIVIRVSYKTIDLSNAGSIIIDGIRIDYDSDWRIESSAKSKLASFSKGAFFDLVLVPKEYSKDEDGRSHKEINISISSSNIVR